MIGNVRLRLGKDQRSTWMIALVLAAVGYVFVMTNYEGKIGDTQEKALDIETLVTSAKVFLVAEPRLRLRERALIEELRVAMPSTDDSEVAAIFLKRVNDIARRDRVTIVQLIRARPTSGSENRVAGAAEGGIRPRVPVADPNAPAGARRPAAPTNPVVDALFVPSQYDVDLTGAYPDLMRAVSDLSRGSGMIEVKGVAISTRGRSSRRDDRGSLRAVVNLAVYRATRTADKIGAAVRPRPLTAGGTP